MDTSKAKYAEDFSVVLKKIRFMRDLSLLQVSQQVGISGGYLSDIEKNLAKRDRVILPHGDFILKLLEFYNEVKEFTPEECNEIANATCKYLLRLYLPENVIANIKHLKI